MRKFYPKEWEECPPLLPHEDMCALCLVMFMYYKNYVFIQCVMPKELRKEKLYPVSL